MKEHTSFTMFERAMLPEFRNSVNRAESPEGLKRLFAYTASELLMKVFEKSELVIAADAIYYAPDKKHKFSVADDLMKVEEFADVWQHSDLRDILRRFAEAIDKHCLYLQKHQEKTNKKIRSV